MVRGTEGHIHLQHAPSAELGFSPSTLEINIHEADGDSAAHWTGSQEMRGLLVHCLCDCG